MNNGKLQNENEQNENRVEPKKNVSTATSNSGIKRRCDQ